MDDDRQECDETNEDWKLNVGWQLDTATWVGDQNVWNMLQPWEARELLREWAMRQQRVACEKHLKKAEEMHPLAFLNTLDPFSEEYRYRKAKLEKKPYTHPSYYYVDRLKQKYTQIFKDCDDHPVSYMRLYKRKYGPMARRRCEGEYVVCNVYYDVHIKRWRRW